MSITNEHQGLSAIDVTDHVVVKKLQRSLNDSFETLVLMILECWDYNTRTPFDVPERLNTHELLIEKQRELYPSGSRRSLDLKATADSSPEE